MTTDCIRAFELEQMSYGFGFCSICTERRLEMKMASDNICAKCNKDKSAIKMFSFENNMDPGDVPGELNLTFKRSCILPSELAHTGTDRNLPSLLE